MLWSVKGGRNGEYEQLMLDSSVVLFDWAVFDNLSKFSSREEIDREYIRLGLAASPARRANHVAQLRAFAAQMKSGDLVVVRMKTKAAIAIGELTGPYAYRQDLPIKHSHPVKWLQTDVPPDRFGQDLLFSFGASQTINRVQRNNAEERVRAIAHGKPDPGIAMAGAKGDASDLGIGEDEALDLGALARDGIRTYLGRRFKGHALAEVVDANLKAQGYTTLPSPPGPDGGVDILAGAGPMGFDSPRLVVQVKSQDSPVDSGVLRELQGILQTHNAQQGLLVSWGGFRNSVRQEAKRSFFSVRLWDQDDLIAALLENYARMNEGSKVDLPLRQVWVLVAPETAEDPE